MVDAMSAAPHFAGPTKAVRVLRDPATIRARAGEVFDAACAGRTAHFSVDLGKLELAAERTVAAIRADYSALDIPYHSRWRHFDAGGVDRWARLAAQLPDDKLERARVGVDLAVASVLLDAGAGPEWRYRTPDGVYARSEGLAVASVDLFASGVFSADPKAPLRADAAALQRFDAQALAQGFQVSAENPLVGLDRLLFDAKDGTLPAARILALLLDGFADAWPARRVVDGVNVGDVGAHPAATDGLVPFHKLSQWLAYSLLEPFEALGLRIVDLDALTGLPEYRNGGLFLDTGVLALKDPTAAARTHDATSELVVEWRALTVVLLDRIADLVRGKLGLEAADFPLAKVLQGGTWTAGRRIAAELREGGPPPLAVASDGTIF